MSAYADMSAYLKASSTNFTWPILKYLDLFMTLLNIYDGAFLQK